MRAAIVSELGPVLASGELQVRLRPASLDPRPTGLMLELRFPAGLPAEVAESRAAEVARRMSLATLLREVYDGVLAVRVRAVAGPGAGFPERGSIRTADPDRSGRQTTEPVSLSPGP